jgi:hypothetical protein
MHEQIETAQRLNIARLLPNTPSFIENHFDERGKSVLPRHLADLE